MCELNAACRFGSALLLALVFGPPARGQVVSVAVGVKPSCPYGLAA